RVASGAIAPSAEVDVQVTISDSDIIAESRLRLKGAAKEWRLVAPSYAEVSVGRAPTVAGGKPLEFPVDQTPDVVRPEPGQSIWKIRFRETKASELLAVVLVRTPRGRVDPKGKSIWPVGPFAVL